MNTQYPTPEPAEPGRPVRPAPINFEVISFVKPSVGAESAGTPELEPEIDRPGTGRTALMLARYLVGRALAARVSMTLWLLAGVLLVGAVALWIVDVHWLAVVVAVLALIVVGVRALVMLALRKVMAVGRLGAAEARITELVHDTGGDLRRELRRIGLPGSVLGMPLLVLRILGRRRRDTFERMRQFDVANVVPRARRAELEFIVRTDVLHLGPRTSGRSPGSAGR